jgi:hypothetical protein
MTSFARMVLSPALGGRRPFLQTLFDRDKLHGRARHHRRRQNAVPALGLHQRDEVVVGAERLGAGFDGGGLGFAGDLDIEALASPFSRVALANADDGNQRIL